MKRYCLSLLMGLGLGCAGIDAPEDRGEPLSLEKAGQEGALVFEVHSRTPLVEGANDLSVVVRRGDEPVADADVVVRSSMPAMKHEPTETHASHAADGEYAAEDLVFSMPGEWHLEIEASADGAHDIVAFLVEVP